MILSDLVMVSFTIVVIFVSFFHLLMGFLKNIKETLLLASAGLSLRKNIINKPTAIVKIPVE